jgi:hypothetical protein
LISAASAFGRACGGDFANPISHNELLRQFKLDHQQNS